MGRFMTPTEASYALDKAGKFHAGEIKLPPEISEMKRIIAEKTRNAELFMARLRVVDEGMIREIVALKLRLDNLYGKWALE